jgi:hypothetical protein
MTIKTSCVIKSFKSDYMVIGYISLALVGLYLIGNVFWYLLTSVSKEVVVYSGEVAAICISVAFIVATIESYEVTSKYSVVKIVGGLWIMQFVGLAFTSTLVEWDHSSSILFNSVWLQQASLTLIVLSAVVFAPASLAFVRCRNGGD